MTEWEIAITFAGIVDKCVNWCLHVCMGFRKAARHSGVI